MDSEAGNLVIILGPTGVGKSREGLKLALKFSGEIINCDSMQVYRGFDIGTDKPSLESRRTVPHHLFDVADPSDQFNAADFVAGALRAVDGILEKKNLPFIVGGTGLYIKALLDGLFPGPGRNPEVRRRLEAEAEEKGLGAFSSDWRRSTPPTPGRSGAGTRSGSSVPWRSSRPPESPSQSTSSGTESFVKDFHLVRIGLRLERPAALRIGSRTASNVCSPADSWTRFDRLLRQGVREDAPPFRALGYRWVLKFIRDEIGLEEAKARTKLDTRHYAKRQMTWFRKMEGVTWFSPEDNAALENHLEKNIK